MPPTKKKPKNKVAKKSSNTGENLSNQAGLTKYIIRTRSQSGRVMSHEQDSMAAEVIQPENLHVHDNVTTQDLRQVQTQLTLNTYKEVSNQSNNQDNNIVKEMKQSQDILQPLNEQQEMPTDGKQKPQHIQTITSGNSISPSTTIIQGTVAQLIDRIDSTPTSSPVVNRQRTNTNTETKVNASQSAAEKSCCNHGQLHEIIQSLSKTTQQLNENVSKLQQEIGSLRDEKGQFDNKVRQIQNIQEEERVKLADALKVIDEHEQHFEAMVGIVTRQNEEIQSIKRTMGQMYTRSVKKNLIISGIDEKQRENPVWTALEFFKKEMEITQPIPVLQAYRIGQGSPRAMLVELEVVNDKARIFQNIGKLKGKTNKKGKTYFVTEQMSDDQAEAKRQQNFIKFQNSKLPPAQRREITFKKGQLYIDSKKYVPEFQTPTIKQLVMPSAQEKQNREEVEIMEGDTRDREKSIFMGYAARVDNIQHVMGAYMAVRKIHPQATHVMAAYRFPGNSPNISYGMNDDGDYGGARKILDALIETRTYNCAVFVVRYFGGTHIGPDRFSFIEEVAKSAITISDPAVRQTQQRRQENESNDQPDEWAQQMDLQSQSSDHNPFGSIPALPNEARATSTITRTASQSDSLH